MIDWGINALNHGSSLAVFKHQQLVMLERCDSDRLDSSIIRRAFNHGGPDKIFWYERPWVKKLRQAKAGQWSRVFDFDDLPRNYIKSIGVNYAKLIYTPHHASHAAAGYYTSPFNHCAVVVLDAIGEFECATIWEGRRGQLTKLWSRSYPNSLGLFYSAFADLLGFVPIQEEYKLQQLALSGDPNRYYKEVNGYFDGLVSLRTNLHRGVLDWPYAIENNDRPDIAAAVQRVFETQVGMVMNTAKKITGADCLVYMGGCAMNSRANKIEVEPVFKYRWSLPQPGDPSSGMGAVLYHSKKRQEIARIELVKHIEISV